jgi:DNA-binding beta-propeller fold protein YncE
MKYRFKSTLGVMTLSLFIFSCTNSGGDNPAPEGTYSDGIIVINGGNFGQNNGTLSFLKRDGKQVIENIYNVANGQASLPPEEGRVEGYGEAGQTGIILFDHMVNGQDKVVLVDASTFVRKTELTAPTIENPRDVVVISETKAYVSNWDVLNEDWSYKDGYLAVINPQTGDLIKKISIGQGPENMLYHQSKVYVGRADLTATQLTVVDSNTDQVIKSIDFERYPNPIGVDANGKLWVKEANRLHRINTTTDEIETTLPVGEDLSKSIGSTTLTPDKTGIIFALRYSTEETNWREVGETYIAGIGASSIVTTHPVLDRVFSSLQVDPKTETVYAAVIPSLSQAGYVYRINTQGVLLDSIRAEVSPEGFFFK